MTTNADIDSAVAGQTVTTLFRDTARRIPTNVAVRWKEGEVWKEWTFAEVADLACRAAGALASAGIGKGDRIVLMLRNCPEFHVLDTAALLVGARDHRGRVEVDRVVGDEVGEGHGGVGALGVHRPEGEALADRGEAVGEALVLDEREGRAAVADEVLDLVG